MWCWEFLVISCMAHVSDVKQYFIRYLNIIFYCIEMWCDLRSSSKLMYGSCIRYKVTFYSICIWMCYLMHTSGIGCKVMILFCLFLSCFRMLIGGRAFLSSSGRAILNSWYAGRYVYMCATLKHRTSPPEPPKTLCARKSDFMEPIL